MLFVQHISSHYSILLYMNNNKAYNPSISSMIAKAISFFAVIMICVLTNTVFAVSGSDSMTLQPQRPTETDSLTFLIRTPDHCSSTQYHRKNVTVNDSEIILYAEYDDRDCRKNINKVGPSLLSIVSGPINAGTYKVYKTEDVYCKPGDIYPAVAVTTAKEYLGQITIRAVGFFEKKAVDRNETTTKQKSLVTYTASRKELTFRLDKAQNVTVTAYIVNGEKSSELSSKRFLPAGIHTFHMDRERFPSGIVVIHVKGENFSDVQMINLTK